MKRYKGLFTWAVEASDVASVATASSVLTRNPRFNVPEQNVHRVPKQCGHRGPLQLYRKAD